MFGFGRPNRSNDQAQKLLHCSFCNKSLSDVRKLIAGPTVHICDECVSVCVDIIVDDRRVSGSGEDAKASLELQAKLRAHRMNAARPLESVASEALPEWHVRCALCRFVVATDDAMQVEDRGVLCDACVSAVEALGARAANGS
jgi:ClpX C4-type zinc finger